MKHLFVVLMVPLFRWFVAVMTVVLVFGLQASNTLVHHHHPVDCPQVIHPVMVRLL